MTPGVFHKWDIVEGDLVLSLEDNFGTGNEYIFQFTSGNYYNDNDDRFMTSLSLPGYITWATEPELKDMSTYRVSILNNIATFLEITGDGIKVDNELIYLPSSYMEGGSTWENAINDGVLGPRFTLNGGNVLFSGKQLYGELSGVFIETTTNISEMFNYKNGSYTTTEPE